MRYPRGFESVEEALLFLVEKVELLEANMSQLDTIIATLQADAAANTAAVTAVQAEVASLNSTITNGASPTELSNLQAVSTAIEANTAALNALVPPASPAPASPAPSTPAAS